MSRLLIIGYGNTLRGDDGAGPAAAERLRGELPEAEVAAVHQLTPELAEPVSAAETAIFVDAAAEGPPGTVCRRELAPEAPAAFTHHTTPSTLLYMAQALYGRAPRAFLYTMGARSFDLSEGLSPEVEAAVAEVVREITGLVRRRGTGNPRESRRD